MFFIVFVHICTKTTMTIEIVYDYFGNLRRRFAIVHFDMDKNTIGTRTS